MARAKRDEFPLKEREFIRDRLSKAKNDLKSVTTNFNAKALKLQRTSEFIADQERKIRDFEDSFCRDHQTNSATQKEIKSAAKNLKNHLNDSVAEKFRLEHSDNDPRNIKTTYYAILGPVIVLTWVILSAVYTDLMGVIGIVLLIVGGTAMLYVEFGVYPAKLSDWKSRLTTLEIEVTELEKQKLSFDGYFMDRSEMLEAQKRAEPLTVEVTNLEIEKLILEASVKSYNEYSRYKPSKS